MRKTIHQTLIDLNEQGQTEKARQEADKYLNAVYVLAYEGKQIFEGTSNECHFKLLDIQPNSCHYAKTYDNYTITPKTK